jgi:hypothetical protein
LAQATDGKLAAVTLRLDGSAMRGDAGSEGITVIGAAPRQFQTPVPLDHR